ncbi:MAG TPA: GNAT family N-acetyltransferase [Pyrinomonadaceae bacterium]
MIVTSDRLILRHFKLEDAAFILSLLNDPAFLHFIGDKGVRTIEDARNYLTNGPIASYQRHGFGLYLVELKDTMTPIGMCGLLKREALEHVDLGFAFMPDYRRQGYGFEAATAVLSHTKDVHDFDRILAITNPDNHSSIKLLEKLGFKFERMIRLPGDTSEIKLFALADKR